MNEKFIETENFPRGFVFFSDGESLPLVEIPAEIFLTEKKYKKNLAHDFAPIISMSLVSWVPNGDLPDLLARWSECLSMLREKGVCTILIRAHARALTQITDEVSSSLLKIAYEQGVSLLIDPGKDPLKSSFFPGWEQVIDPFWHSLSGLKNSDRLYLKIHGWSDERWVRRYGRAQCEKLASRLWRVFRENRKVREMKVWFSHSGRVSESLLFFEAWKKLRTRHNRF